MPIYNMLVLYLIYIVFYHSTLLCIKREPFMIAHGLLQFIKRFKSLIDKMRDLSSILSLLYDLVI